MHAFASYCNKLILFTLLFKSISFSRMTTNSTLLRLTAIFDISSHCRWPWGHTIIKAREWKPPDDISPTAMPYVHLLISISLSLVSFRIIRFHEAIMPEYFALTYISIFRPFRHAKALDTIKSIFGDSEIAFHINDISVFGRISLLSAITISRLWCRHRDFEMSLSLHLCLLPWWSLIDASRFLDF